MNLVAIKNIKNYEKKKIKEIVANHETQGR